jgi:hypothetical protein
MQRRRGLLQRGKQGVVSVEMRGLRKLTSGRWRKQRPPFQGVSSSGHFVTKLANATESIVHEHAKISKECFAVVSFSLPLETPRLLGGANHERAVNRRESP